MAEERDLRVLWASNPPWVPSGYGTQTASAIVRLKAMGFPVAVQATVGFSGMVQRMGGIPIYPTAYLEYGGDMLAGTGQDFGAHVMISLLNVQMWRKIIGRKALDEAPPWVPWVPVDHDPPRPSTISALDFAKRTIAMTKFGRDRLLDAGVRNVEYIPHGLETETFRPMDREQAREACAVPKDAYLVGFVGDNKEMPPRKGLDKALIAFAEFKRTHPEAIIYLHTMATKVRFGIDVPYFCDRLGLMRNKDYFLAPQYDYTAGTISADAMAQLYNACDVLLAPSKNEGFGLPIMEAQACGCPVITTDFTSMGELTINGIAVPPIGREWTGMDSWVAIQDEGGIVDALNHIYDHHDDYRLGDKSKQGIEHFHDKYDWNKLAVERWLPLLDELEKELC